MPLTVDRYTVLLSTNPDGAPSEHEVAVIHGDRMRAELEAPKHNIPPMRSAPMHYVALWLWAACLRTKILTNVSFQDFTDGVLLTFDEVEEPAVFPGDAPAPADPLGPTTEAESASPWRSHTNSGHSLSGSTPTPTPV